MLERLLDQTYMVRLNSFQTAMQGIYRVKKQLLYHVKSVLRRGTMKGVQQCNSCSVHVLCQSLARLLGSVVGFMENMIVDKAATVETFIDIV